MCSRFARRLRVSSLCNSSIAVLTVFSERAAKAASGQAPKPKESKTKPAAKKNTSAVDKVPAPTDPKRKNGAVQTETEEEREAAKAVKTGEEVEATQEEVAEE